MPEPIISVIMPCYNQARFLPEAVASLRAQVYAYWECIIVNDGSSDNTAQLAVTLASFDSRVRLINQKNLGPAAARNRGLEEANGQIVHFLDGDDYILPGMYEKMIEVFKTQSDAVAAYSGFQLVTEDRSVLCSFPVLPESADVFHDLLGRNPWPCHAVMVRKAIVDAVGRFDDALKGPEDWDLWLRVASTGGRFTPVDGESACYRRYANTISTNNCRMLEAGLAVLEKNRRLHKSCRLCKSAVTRGSLRWGIHCWSGFRAELQQMPRAGQLFSYLRFFFYMGRKQLRPACMLFGTLLHGWLVARKMLRIKSPALNADSGE